MTKRDNELSRPELLDKRVKHLLDKWEVHRGQLPQDLITALEGVRKAHEMKEEHPGVGESVPKAAATHDVAEQPGYVAHAEPVPVASEPVPAVALDAPAKPGDLT